MNPELSSQRARGDLLRRLAWLPIPLMLTAMVALWVADLRVAWPLPPLNWLVHYGPVALGVGFIVIPAARSFLANGQPSVLMLGCGVLMMDVGVTALPSGFARSSSTGFAIYNTSTLLGALCHFTGVAVASRGKARLRRSATWLTVAYAGGTAVMGLVIWGAFAGRMPVFFIDGEGGTLLRNLVVSTAVALFLLTAGLLWQTNRRTASPFLYWYALGLVLLAAGLAGSMLIAVRDSPLQWAARLTQVFGTVYMCVAVLASAGETSAKRVPLAAVEEAWREKEFLAGLRQQTPLGWGLRYGLAVAAVAGAFALREALTAWFGPGLPAYVTFYPAVMVVALLAGFGPGLVATALAGFVTAYWILPPVGQFDIASPVDRLGLVIFAGMGLFMSVVAEFYRRNRDKAAAYDHERALREIQREKEFLADLLEHAAQPFAVGYPDGRMGRLNRAYEQLTGYSAAELRALDWSATLTPPEWRELEKQKLDELHRTGQPVRYEKEYIRKDGSRVPIELLVHLARDAKGKPEYYYSFLADITERRRAEQAERASAEHLRQLNAELQAANASLAESRTAAVNLMDDAVAARQRAEQAIAQLRQSEAELRKAQRLAHIGSWYWDAKTDATTGSDELLRVYGLDPAAQAMPAFREQRGRCYPVEDWERVNAAVQETLRTGVGYELDVQVLRDGAPISITTRGEVVRDADGRIVGLRGTVQDITERKRAEEQLRRTAEELNRSNQDLEQFAYVASHDLQEPLRVVSGFLRLLQQRYAPQLDAEANEYIEFAVDGAARMSNLIKDLLEYSRVERKGRELQPTDTNSTLAGALANLHGSIEEAGATITHDHLPTLNADPTQLAQLFQNVIGNAIKFRHADRPCQVHVGAKQQDGQWAFSVRDNGIGIDPKQHERIFEIFQRLHTRAKYPGTGIGLAICKRIVERHGGWIWVESEPGEGSTFRFSIPSGTAA